MTSLRVVMGKPLTQYLLVAAMALLLSYVAVVRLVFPVERTPGTNLVPNVVGSVYDEAARTLDAAGFKAERGDSVVSSGKATAVADTVVDQSPAGGAELVAGGTVTLFTRKGKE